MRGVAILGLVVFLLAGCSAGKQIATTNGSGTSGPIWTPVPSLTAAPTITPTPVPSLPLPPTLGIPIVDAVASAVVARDVDRVMSYVVFGESGLGPGVIGSIACGGLDPRNLQQTRSHFIGVLVWGWELLAVRTEEEPGHYLLIFERPTWNGTPPRWYALTLNERGITTLITGCPSWTEFPRNWGIEDVYRKS